MHMKVSPIIWKLDLSCKTLIFYWISLLIDTMIMELESIELEHAFGGR